LSLLPGDSIGERFFILLTKPALDTYLNLHKVDDELLNPEFPLAEGEYGPLPNPDDPKLTTRDLINERYENLHNNILSYSLERFIDGFYI